MKNSSLFSIVGITFLALFGAGCWGTMTTQVTAPTNTNTNTSPVSQPPAPTTTSQATPSATTSGPVHPAAKWPSDVLVSTANPNTYCNGADMNTDGFRATLTKAKPVSFPANETLAQHAKSVIHASTSGMCQNVLDQTGVTVSNGVAHIAPIDGWAGVSIVMCYCKPQVEVNLLRIPGITQVVWN